MLRTLILLLACLMLLPGTVLAAELLVDGSFEVYTGSNVTYPDYDLTNWSQWSASRRDVTFGGAPSSTPDGAHWTGVETGFGHATGAVYQTVAVQPNSTAVVSAYLYAVAGKYKNCSDSTTRGAALSSAQLFWIDGDDGGSAWSTVPGSANLAGEETFLTAASDVCNVTESGDWTYHSATTGNITTGNLTVLLNFDQNIDWDSYGAPRADLASADGTTSVEEWGLY